MKKDQFPWNNTFLSKSPEDTRSIAIRLVRAINPPVIIALYGGMGSGKTCFVQGLAIGLGIKRPITSPTFTIVNEYPGSTRLVHVDLYRINNLDEIFELGFEETLDSTGVMAIEWAEKAGDLIPKTALHIYFENPQRENDRVIKILKNV